MTSIKFALKLLILICVVGIVAECAKPATQPVSKPVTVVKTRQDMDNVVHLKGVPRQMKESFVGGTHPGYDIWLYYADEAYRFRTDEAKSYTVLLNQTTLSAALPQQPIPLWFKTKYQNLDWTGIPTK